MTRSVVFRADASLQIGNGHIMRCLTLAEALSARGFSCHFICREHPANLIDLVRDKGFPVHVLSLGHMDGESFGEPDHPAHAQWLGTDWVTDASATKEVLAALGVDWLVVDHYALDSAWESAVRPFVRRIMVIDDLVDREHDCDILLDQSLGRRIGDYAQLVPQSCLVLAGTEYALLRPEFAAIRSYSLRRRSRSGLRHLLVTMGGVDQTNATGKVLEALGQCELPSGCRITVVLGRHSPWKSAVAALAREMPWPCEVLIDVADMASLMADCDLAIGAAGSTSWERCALGLPSFVVALANNQEESGAHLAQKGAASLLSLQALSAELAAGFAEISSESLLLQSRKASSLVDGNGVTRVAELVKDS